MSDEKRLNFALSVVDDLLLALIKAGGAWQEHRARRDFLKRSIDKQLQIDPQEHAQLTNQIRARVEFIEACAEAEAQEWRDRNAAADAELAAQVEAVRAASDEDPEPTAYESSAPEYTRNEPAEGPVVTEWTVVPPSERQE